MSTVPDGLRERVLACGFELVGWDDDSGAISHTMNTGIEYVGTHAEIESYLYGWMASREVVIATDRLGQDSPIQAAIVSLCTASGELVRAGRTARIHTRPQVPFRGRRVAIPDEIAPYFDVHDITVGNMSCMPHAANFPAAAFATRMHGLGSLTVHAATAMQPIAITIEERAYAQAGLRLGMPVTKVAMDISIVVTNKSDEDRRFECYVIGQTVRHASPPPQQQSLTNAALAVAWQQIVGADTGPLRCAACRADPNPRWSACDTCRAMNAELHHLAARLG